MKNESKVLTSDIQLINEQLKAVELDKNLKNYIKKTIIYLKSLLSDLVDIRKIGSFAINGLYSIEEEPVVDLLALKYINREMYKTYENEIDSKEHFSDCWICEVNEEILIRLRKKYSFDPEIKVEWNTKKYFYDKFSDDFYLHTDSIKMDFYKNNILGFSIIIRTGLTHNLFPPILCMKNSYHKTNALDYVKTFKTLNNLTVRKLEILFFYIRINFRLKYTKEQRLMMKIMVMSELQEQLTRNKFFQEWATTVFHYLFPNKKIIDELFQSNNLYYKKHKLFAKCYSSLKLKNLHWVFHKTYPKTKDFLDNFLDNCEVWIKEQKHKKDEIVFWYDTNPYIKNSSGDSNFTMKKDKKLFDDLEEKIISKTVYPSDKDIGIFVVFLKYFIFSITD
ncbi:hypothetical protein [Spiroplasma helicoides]|uniref:hypothetical protein n=1 Tax=Spiroplasma helicoides TaxID=216938 RepID=UPI0012EE6816|nr:hypothetical protein [Spiroplasma helicoides]